VRVLICGGRDFADKRLMMGVMEAVEARGPIACVIHGGARGADSIGGAWAKWKGLPVFECAANWDFYGNRAAGPIRNQWMLDHGKPDLVVAFPTSKSVGTHDMTRRAREAGVEVYEASCDTHAKRGDKGTLGSASDG
jgi:hypothetical protein